ncbi:MAG: hypothetical protein H0U74_20370 [Bradymonadaceae bacterium]|nr:hypothetical protein [Lujinxingiaceae bacterium]
MKKYFELLVFGSLALLAPAQVLAHAGHHHADLGMWASIVHAFSSFDHLLATFVVSCLLLAAALLLRKLVTGQAPTQKSMAAGVAIACAATLALHLSVFAT